ncbi:MAG: hypothetical protein JRD05_00760 [Deltaproteobacteria bacterium]|nr:hypothetical protein [Deltaproteobacteria bacterium]
MASPSTPTHGKFGALYRLRPNGFKGNGLNDVTWGTGFSDTDSAYFEAVIDSELGGTAGVDTFKWRKDGGAWTENVDITGSAQTLSDSQTITFAATKEHTLTDQWVVGNLKDEPCTESSATAQITDVLMHLLNPNAPPTFTDAGGKTVLTLNYTNGTAVFTDNVGEVTVTGNNGYIPSSTLEKVGYLIDWNLDITLDMAEISRMGQKWKEFLPGQAGGSGGANAYFIGCDTFFADIEDNIDGTQKYFLLELFNYDPDQDQTGDHTICWVTFNSWNVNAPINDVVKEAIGFQVHGMISFKANA